jgi:mannose-6-phosphate isomerase-like protein (cupin superfamily)
MPGHIPAIALKREPSQASRLVDRHPGADALVSTRHDWGETQVLSLSGGHRVERITVRAGDVMPAHYHHHRSEHWTVMNGEAEVMLGDDVLVVSPDDSLYVPAGVVHGVKAGAGACVELVAVHFGDTVSDDDDMISAA